MITIEITGGEALDRLSILSVKCTRIVDPEKHAIVEAQFAELYQLVSQTYIGLEGWYTELKAINGQLWDMENLVRNAVTYEKDRSEDVNKNLLKVYQEISKKNDERAALKLQVNESCKETGEVKEHV